MPDASFLSSDLFLLTLTVGLYCLGTAVYRRIRMPLLHPVLLTFVAVIVLPSTWRVTASVSRSLSASSAISTS